jgi:hypothetical protein
MFDDLTALGFQIEFHSHARAILAADFADAVTELEAVLASASVPIEEIIAGGGGEAKGTQRLRRALTQAGWRKTTFVVEKRINGVPRESQSHEVDHVREFAEGATRIALEIGLPDSIVTFNEGKAALAEVQAADAEDEPC